MLIESEQWPIKKQKTLPTPDRGLDKMRTRLEVSDYSLVDKWSDVLVWAGEELHR